MHEGIEDIYRLLDTGRLKEALTQLQGISATTSHWELRNQIENVLTAYGYMLQYAGMGMDDPNRNSFYQQTLRTSYELTDATHIALLTLKNNGKYFDCIRTFALQPSKAYKTLQLQLETYTEDLSTVPLFFHDEQRRQTELEKLNKNHETTLSELFEKTWATPFWTEAEAHEANELLTSVLIPINDLAVMVGATTLGLLRVFDVRKIDFLINAYHHDDLQISQRAIVGMTITLYKHEKRIQLYPELLSRLSLLSEDDSFRKNLYTIQMQLLITRETTKIDKKMREEIIPEMMKNAKQLNDPKFRFEESEDSEDRNPEWEEWMDKSGMSDKIREMGEWQMAGADVYMSSFAQLKNYPFFHQISHWFYPFDLNLPILEPLQKDYNQSAFSPLKLITNSDYFCNSDKYSFCLAMLSMPKQMKDLSIQQMEQQIAMNEENKSRLEALMKKNTDAKSISRQYIQDLYRFFKLWRNRQEEEDIFQWKFNLWENDLLKDALLQDTITKELADYLLQKEYLEEAYTLYEKLMNNPHAVAEVYQKAGFIRQKQKQYAEAIRHYLHADLLTPDNLWTNKHLAQCYRLSNDLVLAINYYRKVEAVQPDNLNIALQIGQCLARLENYTEALAYFYKVEYLENNPDNARRAIAWCSFVCGKQEEALKYYRLLLTQETPKAQDWMNAGHVYFAMRQIPQAIEHYQKAQSFEKNHSAFIEKFHNDMNTLQTLGLTKENIQIMLDLLV